MKKQPDEPICWVIEKFENGHAVLQGKAGRLIVPRGYLSTKVKAGDFVSADFYFLKDFAKRRKNLAKSLLEEILREE